MKASLHHETARMLHKNGAKIRIKLKGLEHTDFWKVLGDDGCNWLPNWEYRLAERIRIPRHVLTLNGNPVYQ